MIRDKWSRQAGGLLRVQECADMAAENRKLRELVSVLDRLVIVYREKRSSTEWASVWSSTDKAERLKAELGIE